MPPQRGAVLSKQVRRALFKVTSSINMLTCLLLGLKGPIMAIHHVQCRQIKNDAKPQKRARGNARENYP